MQYRLTSSGLYSSFLVVERVLNQVKLYQSNFRELIEVFIIRDVLANQPVLTPKTCVENESTI